MPYVREELGATPVVRTSSGQVVTPDGRTVTVGSGGGASYGSSAAAAVQTAAASATQAPAPTVAIESGSASWLWLAALVAGVGLVAFVLFKRRS